MRKPSFYIRLVKRARGFMRGRLIKSIPYAQRALKPLMRREYWLPTPHRVAMGCAIGVFFALAMLVVPVQMLGSALMCIYFKGNLPVAIGTCWISNPFTVPPLAIGMVWVGSQFDRFIYETPEKLIGIYGLSYKVNLYHFGVGCVFSGLVLSLLTYPSLYSLLKYLEHSREKNRTRLERL